MMDPRTAYQAYLMGWMSIEEAAARGERWYAEFRERHPMQEEHQDAGITPLAGRYAERTERFMARLREETPPSTAEVHSSGNGLRFWYVCMSCDVRSLTESFDRGQMEVRARLHDALVHRESAA